MQVLALLVGLITHKDRKKLSPSRLWRISLEDLLEVTRATGVLSFWEEAFKEQIVQSILVTLQEPKKATESTLPLEFLAEAIVLIDNRIIKAMIWLGCART